MGGRKRRAIDPRPAKWCRVEIPQVEKRTISGEDIPVTVVYEDEALLVVDKPAGMVVHPAPGNWSGTLVNALLGRGGSLSTEGEPERAGMVHRLDKETSGLLVVAKTDRSHRLLSAAIAARRVMRRYAVDDLGSPSVGHAHDRQADSPRPPRPEAHGNRQ